MRQSLIHFIITFSLPLPFYSFVFPCVNPSLLYYPILYLTPPPFFVIHIHWLRLASGGKTLHQDFFPLFHSLFFYFIWTAVKTHFPLPLYSIVYHCHVPLISPRKRRGRGRDGKRKQNEWRKEWREVWQQTLLEHNTKKYRHLKIPPGSQCSDVFCF